MDKVQAINKKLERVYFNPAHPCGYGSYSTLRKFFNASVSDEAIKRFLRAQEVYTLHAPVRRRFQRDYVFATNIDDVWHMDLMDMQQYKKENNGMGFVLVLVDVLSKFAFAKCIKDKTAATVRSALESIFKGTDRRPQRLYCDKGLEFKNKTVKTYLRTMDVDIHFAENSDTKACCAERLIRTLKTRLWRYFTHVGNHRYVDVLHKIVDGYNKTYHRSIETTPQSVTEENFLSVWRKLYQSRNALKGTKPKLKRGDHVRVSKIKKQFTKGFEDNFSHEIFVVTRVLLKRPVMYEIEDLDGESVSGRFYERELVQVTPPDYFKVDKIIGERGVGVKKEYHVQWKGYPSKFNSWVRASDLKK